MRVIELVCAKITDIWQEQVVYVSGYWHMGRETGIWEEYCMRRVTGI